MKGDGAMVQDIDATMLDIIYLLIIALSVMTLIAFALIIAIAVILSKEE